MEERKKNEEKQKKESRTVDNPASGVGKEGMRGHLRLRIRLVTATTIFVLCRAWMLID